MKSVHIHKDLGKIYSITIVFCKKCRYFGTYVPLGTGHIVEFIHIS